MFAGNFAPNGWMFCEGQTLPISENEVLFQLLGTTYGGDGEETFNLPNLASRIPIHFGTGPDGTTYQIGEQAGTEQVTLSIQQTPNHSHPLTGSSKNGTEANGAGNFLSTSTTLQPYAQVSPADAAFANSVITPQGGSQPHENVQPFLCVNYIISLFGVFPSQT